MADEKTTKLTGPEDLRDHWDDMLQDEFEDLVRYIEEGMREKGAGYAGKIYLDIEGLPSPAVKRRIEEGYRKAGWRTVEFDSSQRGGNTFKLEA